MKYIVPYLIILFCVTNIYAYSQHDLKETKQPLDSVVSFTKIKGKIVDSLSQGKHPTNTLITDCKLS